MVSIPGPQNAHIRRWALTEAQGGPQPHGVSLTARAHPTLVIALGKLGQMGLWSQCLSHSQPGCTGQNPFLPFALFGLHRANFALQIPLESLSNFHQFLCAWMFLRC
jgi:hypothetical protein